MPTVPSAEAMAIWRVSGLKSTHLTLVGTRIGLPSDF
jgi:hypothetical protein